MLTSFQTLHFLVKLSNHIILRLNQRVYQLLLVVLLCFLLGYFFDFLVDKVDLIRELFAFIVFAIEVAFKLCH